MSIRGTFVFVNGKRLMYVLAGVLLIAPSSASAIDLDALRQRLEERRAERQERLDELRGNNTPSPTPNSEPTPGDSSGSSCTCSARIGFDKPSVQWRGNTLEFTPRFDIDIRVRGEENAEPWNAQLSYSGKAHNTPFSGQQTFGGQCFDGRYKYSGIAGTPVSLTDVVRSLFSGDNELDALVTMHGEISGCDTDTEDRKTTVTIEEFGNLKTRGWRFWRP